MALKKINLTKGDRVTFKNGEKLYYQETNQSGDWYKENDGSTPTKRSRNTIVKIGSKIIQEMTQQQILKEEINNIINQNKQEVLTFESNPLEYILKKYPSLNETLIDLLTKEFRDYITGIFILAPKPTIFKILLHNGQFFYLTYTTQGYTAKVSGKQYSLMNLKEQEYAIKSISNLLLLGLPPGAQGPTEENDNNADMKNDFVADMTSEPNLDGVNSEPENNPGEEETPEVEPIKEQKTITKFRIIK